MMGAAMAPLKESEAFINILTKFENPLLGILAGMIFTAIIQSSSASVGILQTLAASGVISLNSAAFVLFGQNIGTCIFTTLCIVTPIISLIEGITPGDEMAQIANLHTTFNIVTTLLLLPFGNYLAKFAEIILKDKKEDEDDISVHFLKNIKDITEEKIGVSAISMEGTKKEIWRMLGMAKQNVHDCFDVFIDGKDEAIVEVEKKEEYIDFLNKEISKYISRVITHERTEKGSSTFNSYYTITSNIERIGDHAMNISGYSEMLTDFERIGDHALNISDEIMKIRILA